METQEQTTLGKYGKSFQRKSIATLLNEKVFMQQMRDVLDPDYYNSEANKWIVEKVVRYWDKYKKTPTLDFFKTEINTGELGNALKASVLQELKFIWNARENSDLDYVKDEFLEFAQNQRMRRAIMKCVDHLNANEYGVIRKEIDSALNAGLDKNIGHLYKEDIEERMKESARPTVTTGFSVIDDIMDGGMAGGEVGVFVGASGAGKSWFLAKLGSAAMNAGLFVAHYTLELSDTQTGLRYDSILSGHSPNEVRLHKEEVTKLVEDLPGNIAIQRWPAKTATIQNIHAHVERLKTLHEEPDLIVLDYADLLKSVSSTGSDAGSYQTMASIYTELRKLSGELDIPIWTVSQSNREGNQADIITADMIADSFQKIMISDFVASISRQAEDKVLGTARIHIIKNRFGPDGMTFPAVMSTETGQIKIFEEGSDEAEQLARQINMASAEQENAKIGELYRQFTETGTVQRQ